MYFMGVAIETPIITIKRFAGGEIKRSTGGEDKKKVGWVVGATRYRNRQD